uniref:tyrosine-protein phosphatase n=1 Tax=Marinobacterium profundum TaxID=1714300 RepID=UPI000832216D|nr:CpsB/CapC family capsule biosynthesis tyrosine phosphatase [Marinobacterium profundum]
MIDLHCHLLPGIDDGASSIEDALSLARMAVADGITHAVLTPHLHPGRYDNTPEIIQAAVEAFRAALIDAQIPLEVKAAAEVRLSAELLMLIGKGQVPFLGRWDGKDVLLLELPHSHIPPGTEKLIKWLQDRNILPMIAHPERNKAIMADIGKLSCFVDMGCLFQLTAMSITGGFGAKAQAASQEMLHKGWATVIASDAHNTDHRPPLLSRAFKAAAELVGEADARQLVLDRPAKIAGFAL